jgi:hypothetical protein
MMNLPGERGFIGACSSESERLQQPMKVGQTRHVNCGTADRHRRAYGWIKHPSSEDNRIARFCFDNDDFRSRPLFCIKLSDLTAIQRVPPIMDLHLPIDMGRMNAPLPLAASHGYLPVLIVEVCARQRCTA